MNKHILLTLSSILFGIILFLYFNEIIIINVHKTELKKEMLSNGYKKSIDLFYWKNNKWNKESIDILWTNSLEQNIYQIVNNWLMLLDEEKITNKKITLQSALIANSVLYVSFDSSLFSEDFSTYKKLMILESILKTLRENKIEITQVYFLVHHEIMEDHHLDFSNTWPTVVFLNC